MADIKSVPITYHIEYANTLYEDFSGSDYRQIVASFFINV